MAPCLVWAYCCCTWICSTLSHLLAVCHCHPRITLVSSVVAEFESSKLMLPVPRGCIAIAESTAVLGNIIEEILLPVPEPLKNIKNNDETVYFINFHVTVLASLCTTYSLNWLISNLVVTWKDFKLQDISNLSPSGVWTLCYVKAYNALDFYFCKGSEEWNEKLFSSLLGKSNMQQSMWATLIHCSTVVFVTFTVHLTQPCSLLIQFPLKQAST